MIWYRLVSYTSNVRAPTADTSRVIPNVLRPSNGFTHGHSTAPDLPKDLPTMQLVQSHCTDCRGQSVLLPEDITTKAMNDPVTLVTTQDATPSHLSRIALNVTVRNLHNGFTDGALQSSIHLPFLWLGMSNLQSDIQLSYNCMMFGAPFGTGMIVFVEGLENTRDWEEGPMDKAARSVPLPTNLCSIANIEV